MWSLSTVLTVSRVSSVVGSFQIEIAQIINNHVREEDCFARIGGEEFALLLFNTKIRRAYVIAERIRRMIADSKIKIHDATQETVSITISVGISTFTTYDTSIENIIARADEAMYLAKKEGRNKVKIEQ
ncbi:GGDEF domain-containing protein [Sulfurospirillum sp. UCH001]|uniref:GGDEF domain-containing protein n=1 Tax=Sulfurospirillum sp. UCH001 TaxID=1581011 RepID=UPI00082DDBB7|nr:GGDEF domain-containing protein [Sulfurospirillum sp. UCH001]